jgi:hypothetical protein
MNEFGPGRDSELGEEANRPQSAAPSLPEEIERMRQENERLGEQLCRSEARCSVYERYLLSLLSDS